MKNEFIQPTSDSGFFGVFPLPVPSKDVRPKCPECGKIKKIEFEREPSPILGIGFKKTSERKIIGWRFTYPISGQFCTLRCASSWANRNFFATFEN